MTSEPVEEAVEYGLKADAREVLAKLEEQDKLTADAVLAHSVDPDSPFHDEVWKLPDDAAAHQHRLAVCRGIVQRWKFYIVDGTGQVHDMGRRTFYSPNDGRYKNVERAARENGPEIEAIILRDLRAVQVKYQRFGQFQRLVRRQLLGE